MNLGELLLGKLLGPFLDALEDNSGNLDMLIRKTDKKRDKALLATNLAESLPRLAAEFDPAALLHRAVLLLFQRYTGDLLKAPGPSVPKILTFLKNILPPSEHALLLGFQQGVSKFIIAKRGSESSPGAFADQAKSLEADGERIKVN